MPMVFKRAPWAIAFVIRRLGFHAVTLPNGKAYFLEPYLNDRGLRWHELAHLRQLQQHGQKFWLMYYKELLTVGYQHNRFEIEADAYRTARRTRQP